MREIKYKYGNLYLLAKTYAEMAHPVPDQRILFKKSLMVLKDPYGSSEVPYTPESRNSLLKNFQIIRYVFAGFSTFHYID